MLSLDTSPLLITPADLHAAERLDMNFAPDFERGLPKAYYDMLARAHSLPLQSVIMPADAIRGFHFTTQHLATVKPVGGNLYFFPSRPSVQQMQELGRLAAQSSGWGGRIDNERDSEPVYVHCVEIAPTTDTADQLVTVRFNARYGSGRGLLGLGVTANETLTWDVRDSMGIRVEPYA